MRHKRMRRQAETPELDVTPFMNLMIVLVPVLLLSLVFTHTTVIELDFPGDGVASKNAEEAIHLEVQILADALVIADQRSVIQKIPRKANGQHDYETLSLVMQGLKQRLPSKRDATILLAPDTDYQTLVSVMDGIRAYPDVKSGERRQHELFPELSLGDIPNDQSRTKAG